jgi:hypothetical protein
MTTLFERFLGKSTQPKEMRLLEYGAAAGPMGQWAPAGEQSAAFASCACIA